MDRGAGNGATVRWRLARTRGLPLKLIGEEPASIGDVSLCDDTAIKCFGAALLAAPTAALPAGEAAQPARVTESTFWAGLLEGTVEVEVDWHTVYVDGAPRLGFQLAPNHVAPDWPDGEPQQLHLDLYVDDIPPATPR